MEPYRPFVDEMIFSERDFFSVPELEREQKARLFQILVRDVLIKGGNTTFVQCSYLFFSFIGSLFSSGRKLNRISGISMMSAAFQALSRYEPMWLYVMFDLPTNTKRQRKAAADFRKGLVKDGFSMMQFSVYIRNCASYENTLVHIKRVKSMVPEEGVVSILKITDRQFGDTCTFIGNKAEPPPKAPLQLELF